jgi:O-antigen/teichoic acid export membrane protein
MSQLKKGAALSYINIFLTNVIGLFLTPFIIKHLGNSEYGLYILIGGVIAYISVLDLGLNNTIIRYVSKYRAENDKIGEEKFLTTIMFIYSIISVAVTVIGFIVYYNLDSIFSKSLTVDELEKAKIMFLILIFNLAITLPGGSFTAICNAYEKFVFPRLLSVIKYLSRTLLILVLLYKGGDAITLVWIDTILNISIILISVFYVLKKLKVKFSYSIIMNKHLVKEIFSYSLWIFLYAIVMQMQWNAGQTVLGINVDTVTVAIFGVGVMLGTYYGAFAGVVNTLLLPRATKLSVSNDNAETYTSEMIKVGRINMCILFAILAAFYLFGQEFIHFWIGDSYQQSWLIALLIMLAMTLPLIQSFGTSILEAKKKNRFKSLLSISTLSIGIICGYILSVDYGMYGMIYPLVIAIFINSIVMLWYFKKVFQFKIGLFLKNVFLKASLNLAIVVIVCKYFMQIVVIKNWFYLLLFMTCFIFLYIITVHIFVLNKEEKKLIWLKK